MPKLSILINTFDYARYLGRAIDSVLAQSRPADEIVVVDDGSTDETDREVRPRYDGHPKVRWIRQSNGGQLSAIQTGVLAATGDICFFLDADDRYHARHLELVEAYYERHPRADFVFTGARRFRGDDPVPVDLSDPECRDFGISILRTYYRTPFIGDVTSTLSCRAEILKKVFPFSEEILADYRIRADDGLVFGASLAGANKHRYGVETVYYRIHDENHWFGRETDRIEEFRHRMRVRRLIRYLADRFRIGDHMRHEIPFELRTIPHPCWDDLDEYDAARRMAFGERRGFFARLHRSVRKRVWKLRERAARRS